VEEHKFLQDFGGEIERKKNSKDLGAEGRIILTLTLKYSRTPLIRINWDGETSGYAENPDNCIFL